MPNFIIKDIKTQQPIVNLGDQINAITVVRYEDLQAAHWEVFCHATSGATIKVDLMEAGYRVLYGAEIRLGNASTSERLTLGATRTLGQLIEVVKQIAAAKGDWTGTDTYNCQDFVIAFMKTIGMSCGQIFKYDLRRVATKHYPPVITENIGGNIVSRM
jgi:hypothetical protein